MSPWLRAAVALLCVTLGVACGLAAMLVHRDWYGLALGFGVALAAPLALPAAWWGRASFGVGWSLAVVAVLVPPPGGGFVLVGDLLGYAVLGGSFVLLAACVWTSRPGRRAVGVGPSS